MPSERAEEPWVDAMDGPERLERAKKRRAEQMKRWERRESTTTDDVKRKRIGSRVLKFEPNVVILEAAARNDLDEVAQLLESGVSPDLANDDGLTALHQSCIDGCDDMVRYLVEHNANINAHDKESWTPLHAAAACGHMTIIRYLVENGGDVIALNLDGNLPVDVVEDNEKVEKYLDQQMLKLGYDEAAVEKLRLNQGKQLFDDLKDSVEKGRSLDIQDGMGATAFHVAAANGWTNIVEYLLENEADFEIRDNDGWQPIHAAAAWGHDTILEILAASGADLDSRTNDSQTPIDLTEEDEMIELIEELKTKEVKYPRKGKGVRRKRSNTNSSIKRSSIHEKNELSHADTKAERAALFIQLQNAEDSEANSPDETSSSPRKLEVIVGERASDSLRDETGSSGYVSEGSTDTKTDEKSQTNGKTDFFQAKTAHDETKNDNEKVGGDYIHERKEKELKDNMESAEKEENTSVPTDHKESPNNIQQALVTKPPRLSSSSREPKTYINLAIEPSGVPKMNSGKEPTKDNVKVNSESENVRLSVEKSPNNTELDDAPVKEKTGEQTNPVTDTTTSLPRLASKDKRKAPEPPGTVRSAKNSNAKPPPVTEPKKSSTSEAKKGDGMFVFKPTDYENETPSLPTKRAVPSSSPDIAHRNTAVTKSQHVPDDGEIAKVNKTGRGLTLPRSRKTCCLVM